MTLLYPAYACGTMHLPGWLNTPFLCKSRFVGWNECAFAGQAFHRLGVQRSTFQEHNVTVLTS